MPTPLSPTRETTARFCSRFVRNDEGQISPPANRGGARQKGQADQQTTVDSVAWYLVLPADTSASISNEVPAQNCVNPIRRMTSALPSPGPNPKSSTDTFRFDRSDGENGRSETRVRVSSRAGPRKLTVISNDTSPVTCATTELSVPPSS